MGIGITTRHFLYLSGTPFRAISSGEFIEEQIFNWTYTDEQRAKQLFSKKFPKIIAFGKSFFSKKNSIN